MLASIFSLNVLQTALELGCIYALVALALFLSYSILNIADLSTDGCFTLGCAVACQVALTGHPILALAAAMAAGVCSGFVTAFLQTRLGVESIMAGIIVNTGLYTINLAVMGFSSTMSLVKTPTIFSMAKTSLGFLGSWYKLVLAAVIIAIACAAMLGFLGTRLGLSIRATGDNAAMVRASSINPAFTITVGLCVSGALCALSGGLLAQYQKSCDINVGTGIAAGTVSDGRLIFGSHFNAGEVGHTASGIDLRADCVCGRPDCVESVASGLGLDKCARLLAPRFPGTALHIPQNGARVSAAEIFERYDADPLCKTLADNAAEGLANLIMNLVRMSDPDTIVLGGGVMTDGFLYRKVLERLNPYTIRFVTGGVVLTGLDPAFVGLMGACSNAIKGMEETT